MYENKNLRAFTILELSIVISIIAIIIGGIFVGKDLILAARLNKIIAKLEGYETARMAFKQKFECSPGDCPFATDFGLGLNGNGTGYITDSQNPPGSRFEGEIGLYWTHLGAANMINDNLSKGTPPSGYHNANISILYFPQIVSNYYVIGINADDGAFPNEKIDRLFYPKEMYYIDNKLDDGLPLGGKYVSFQQNTVRALNPFPDGDINNKCYIPTNPVSASPYRLTYTKIPSCASRYEFRRSF